MSIEYREQQNKMTENKINRILTPAPIYVKEFYNHMHHGKREISTQISYIRDTIDFLDYLQSANPSYKETELKNLPIELLTELKLQDINEYRCYLKDGKKLANSSIKKKFASISAFYHYLNLMEYTTNNPMVNFESPAINKKKMIKLDATLSNKLLNGILKNDRYLVKTENGNIVMDIDEKVRITREKLVLRNYAICCLCLGTGLRVSEIVGLDLDDINFHNNSLTIVAKGGDETEVFFGDEVEKALKEYIRGVPLQNSDLLFQEPELAEWCKLHRGDDHFLEHLTEDHPECNETMKKDLLKLRYSMLRQGRDALLPKKGNSAVFITTRGTRMSVRSVELMVKEMVQTYLEDYEDKDKFSPHKLRTTCATRILQQTGDIQLASTQLNHKGIAVTASFYAELQKEQQKEKVKKLDINNW